MIHRAGRQTQVGGGIVIAIDASGGGASYVGAMRLEPFLRRYAVDGFVVLLAVLWQAWIWIDGAPFAIVAAALLGTLPLLLRRRFPFGAPVLVFAGLAGMSLADPETGADFVVLTPFSGLSLALAFWFAGGHEKREQAIAATAIGLASVVAVARRQGEEFVVTGADSDLGIVGLLLIAGGTLVGLIRPPAASAGCGRAREASRAGSSGSARNERAPRLPPSAPASRTTSTT